MISQTEKDDAMPPELERDWVLIRAEYESGVGTIEELLARHKVFKPTLYARADKEGWVKRQSVRETGRASLIARLAKMLERQISHLEKNMTGSDDKEVTLLGNMARTLEKLIDLDRKQDVTGNGEKRDAEMVTLRKKLAARIEQLKNT